MVVPPRPDRHDKRVYSAFIGRIVAWPVISLGRPCAGKPEPLADLRPGVTLEDQFGDELSNPSGRVQILLIGVHLLLNRAGS